MGEGAGKGTVREATDSFFDDWTAHGFVRAYRKDHPVRRFIWFLICLLFLGYSGYNSVTVILEFFQYPVAISITKDYEPTTVFPAVTVCNLNPLVYNINGLEKHPIWKYFLDLDKKHNETDCDDLKYDDGDYFQSGLNTLFTDALNDFSSSDDNGDGGWNDDSSIYADDDDYATGDSGTGDSGTYDYDSGTGDSGTYDYDSGTGDSGTGDSGTGDSGTYDYDSGTGDSGTYDYETGTGDSSTGDPANDDNGTGDSDSGDSGIGNSDTGDSDTEDSDNGNSDSGDSDIGDSDTGDSGTDDSDIDVSLRTQSVTAEFKPSDYRKLGLLPYQLPKYRNVTESEKLEYRSQCSTVYPILQMFIDLAKGVERELEDVKKCPISDFKESVMFSIACKSDIVFDVFGAYLNDMTEYKEVAKKISATKTTFKPSCPGAMGLEFDETELGFHLDYGLSVDILENILKMSITTDMSDIRGLFAPTLKEILAHSLPKQKFVLSCSFNNEPCSFKDFYQWTSDHIGTCYTFNSLFVNKETSSGKKKKTIKPRIRPTPLSGPSSGLSLTLGLNTEEHMNMLSSGVGIRTMIHHKNVIPFPEDEGVNISPGMKSTLAISKTKTERVGPPYTQCRENDYYTKGKTIPKQEKYRMATTMRYTRVSCQKLCLEREIRKKCGCAYSKSPMFVLLDLMHPELPTNLTECNGFNYTQKYCIFVVKFNMNRGKLNCGCDPACEEVNYKSSLSISDTNYPYYTMVTNLKKQKIGDDLCSESQNNTVRLQVYLDSMEFEKIEYKPAYSFASFLGNMGGSLGLFLGISLVSFAEFIELLINYVIVICKRGCKTNSSDRVKPIIVQPRLFT